MTCADVRPLLRDPTAVLDGQAEAHVLECCSCQELRLSFARLDALLASEPAPAAPPELTARVLRAVAARAREVAWARDVAWARRQALLLVAAAALVAGLGLLLGWAPVDALTSGARLEANALLAELAALADALLARGERALGPGTLPAPPLLLLALAAPALVLLDRWVCAPARRSA